VVVPADMLRRLSGAGWLKRPEVRTILLALDGEGLRTRAVGGVVRDTLLGIERESNDIDLATELTPDEVSARAQAAGVAVYPTGVEHGTLTLRLNHQTIEVTTLREDVETDGRRARVRFGSDWQRDAERRDFTLNALYAGIDGALFDPLGGATDLVAGRVRFIGDADQRIAEDRLRVFRFFRFSASHGGQTFDAEGLDACRRAGGELATLSAERVGSEMTRMLMLPKISATLGVMAEAGILAINPYCLRALQAYERRSRKPMLTGRLALLIAFGDAPVIQSRWRLSNDEMAAATAILSASALLREFKIAEAAYRFPAYLPEAVDVATALEGWTDAGKSVIAEQLRTLPVGPFPVGGDDLIALGFTPGRALGQQLERLELAWIESGFTLDKAGLLSLSKRA
jgi:poly(A) polymerase